MGQPLFEHLTLPWGPARDRSWLHISGLSTPLEPAFYGGHRHREGLCNLLPGCTAIDGREHPQSQILRIWFHFQRLTHGSILTGTAVRWQGGWSVRPFPVLLPRAILRFAECQGDLGDGRERTQRALRQASGCA